MATRTREQQEAYLLARIDRSAGRERCWPWTLSTGSHGYGQCYDGQTVVLAHRLAWLTWRGPLGPLDHLDHVAEICTTKLCCNVLAGHLEVVTIEENSRRQAVTALAGKCQAGLHDYVPGNGGCHPCKNARSRARYAQLRAAGASVKEAARRV